MPNKHAMLRLKYIVLRLSLTVIAVALQSTLTFSQDCRILESLPDGTKVIQCGSTEYRAITAEHVRRIDELIVKTDILEKINEEYKRVVEAMQNQLTTCLTQNSELQQMIEKIESKAKRGKLDKVLESRFWKLLSAAAPVVVAVLVSR